MRRHKITLTTAADGTVVGYTPRISGFLQQIEYVKDGANGYAAGVDFTITGEATGLNIWTQSNVDASVAVAPRLPTASQVGVAALYAAAGTAVQDRIALANDRVKISLAAGGNAKVGVFYVVVNDK